ncbi:MAG: amidohydrolase/deacetylase family metallohydrolase, partial [Acidobacteriota bacterium]
MLRFLGPALLLATAAFAQDFDLLLQGGRVIDPKSRLDAPRDIAIKAGKIAAIEPSLPAHRARRGVDVGGLGGSPGLRERAGAVYDGG